MRERAYARMARYNISHVRLIQMDATHLDFPDNSFDIVYAPYFITCVPDPIAFTREMRRVCRPDGRLVFLNHFLSDASVLPRFEPAIPPPTVHPGFRSDSPRPPSLPPPGPEP